MSTLMLWKISLGIVVPLGVPKQHILGENSAPFKEQNSTFGCFLVRSRPWKRILMKSDEDFMGKMAFKKPTVFSASSLLIGLWKSLKGN